MKKKKWTKESFIEETRKIMETMRSNNILARQAMRRAWLGKVMRKRKNAKSKLLRT